jgi:hypothetical protein
VRGARGEGSFTVITIIYIYKHDETNHKTNFDVADGNDPSERPPKNVTAARENFTVLEKNFTALEKKFTASRENVTASRKNVTALYALISFPDILRHTDIF